MNLRVFETVADLVQEAAAAIVQRVTTIETSIAIALSGGSTPKPLYELLARSPCREVLAEREITWVVMDERCVPHDDPQSNAGMIEKTLFASGMSPRHQFLRFRTELNDPARTAEEFEEEWREIGIPQLDIALFGVGEDGHTASLFPGTPVLEVEERIASEVFVPRLNAWRVTLTAPVLRAARMKIVLAAGASKRQVVQQIREGGMGYPIERVISDEPDTWWFVDRTAVATDA